MPDSHESYINLCLFLPLYDFTSVVFWNGKKYYYDGLKDTDKTRLIQFEKKKFVGFQGTCILLFNLINVVGDLINYNYNYYI